MAEQGGGASSTEAGGAADELDELHGIQQVARQLGISMRTMRFYEDKGLIEPRRVGMTRIYTRREVARMQLILRGKRLGFSLREIKRFLDLYNTDPKHLEQLKALAERVDERIEELNSQKVALDETLSELREIRKETSEHIRQA